MFIRLTRKVGGKKKKRGEKVGGPKKRPLFQKTKKWGISKKKKSGREVGTLRKIPFFP